MNTQADHATTLSAWVGLRSYRQDDRDRFFGRGDEVIRLIDQVRQFPLTVMHGLSGSGKSSLVSAALLPALRELGWITVPLRLLWTPAAPSPEEQIFDQCRRTLGLPSLSLAPGTTLWELFRHPDLGLITDLQGKPHQWLLYFDQFEENLPEKAPREESQRRMSFLLDLIALVQDYPPSSVIERIEADAEYAMQLRYNHYWPRILVSMRQDYLHAITEAPFSDCRTNMGMFSLGLLNGFQALEAVLEPAKAAGIEIGGDAAEAVIRQIADWSPGNDLESITVSPAILNLTCHSLDLERIALGSASITLEQVRNRSHSVLASYYASVLSSHPPAVEHFIEDRLITESGHRNLVAFEDAVAALESYGVIDAVEVIERLVGQRFLTIDERSGIRSLEIVHDVLCPAVRACREERRIAEQLRRSVKIRRDLLLVIVITILCLGLLVFLLMGDPD